MLLDDETRKNVEISISYARSADAFKYLRCDPSTLKPSEIPHSPTIITGVAEELKHLTRVFTVQGDIEGISKDIERCLQLVWPTLVPWLDFLHPMHCIRNARSSLIPLTDLCGFFRSIYALEDSTAQKLRAESQRLCDLLFNLWLHFDTYNAGESTDVLCCLYMLGEAVREALYVAGFKGHLFKVDDDTCSKEEDSHQLCPAYISPVCASAALSAVRYHPRRLYRKAMVQVRLALEEDSESGLAAAGNQILAIIELATEVVPLLKPAHDIVCDLVSLMRALASRDGGAQWTAGVGLILMALWQSARDERPIVWALRAGLLPLVLALPDGGQKATVLDGILASAYRVRVLRALSSDGQIPAISPSKIGENPFKSPDAWLEGRMKLMNDQYRDICDNVEYIYDAVHASTLLIARKIANELIGRRTRRTAEREQKKQFTWMHARMQREGLHETDTCPTWHTQIYFARPYEGGNHRYATILRAVPEGADLVFHSQQSRDPFRQY
ncbi:hypothetical protein EV715DRAFT_275846 [Schizophyllum commune]